ncbi:DNA N-6-adenine-methyltransferase [Vibrio cholerae]
MNNANLINQSSGDTEYYTPLEWVEAARQVMGSIELDPASSHIANQTVKAERFFTIHDDGLKQDWKAETLWMNHPFHRGEKACPADRSKCKKKNCIPSRSKKKKTRGHHIDHDIPSNDHWISKLMSEYEKGHVKEAICITFANTSEIWFRKLLPHLQCFPNGRVHYRKPDGTICNSVTKGSVITYIGNNPQKFKEVFSRLGTVK